MNKKEKSAAEGPGAGKNSADGCLKDTPSSPIRQDNISSLKGIKSR
jgi:hypothetical protein